ncbi:head decoration protein [Aquibium microcysteis]|uniref:head decoration protein n=1 Tax=Aquibium microcysteis TaxID=675281 RepID=UPI00165CFCC4|nr:head decoration protein [Aquibium microcysteis]
MQNATYDPNGLLAGDFPVATRTITLKSGQNLKRGAVIGMDGNDKFLLSLGAAADGSEVPTAVLAIDCDASGGDKATTAYFTGEFNDAKLTYGAGHSAASVNAAFRDAATPMFVRVLP